MKKFHVVMYSALLLLFCSALSQAQQGSVSTRNGDSNAVSPTPGDVIGTGKKDYVPLWLSPSRIGDSNIFQSSGLVGIGTTTPAAALDVNGTVNAANGYSVGGIPFAYGSLSYNTFLGFYAGNTTMTGGSNTAVGLLAFPHNTTGTFNTTIGEASLNANTTGTENAAIGSGALELNTTGGANTASGWASLINNTIGSYNTGTGNEALYFNTTGGFNTASGTSALQQNTTGGDNTASGYLSLLWNTTGSFNTGLGTGAGPDSKSNNLSYATAIGACAIVSQSNALVLGGPLCSGANVNVGIGTATPSNVFTIAQGAGQAISDGWSVYSSRRWKTNIQTLDDALGKVEQLRGVSYELKANGKHEVGVIAEEVGAVVPEVVTWDKNGTDAQGVDYSRLTALLIEATKEQQALIEHQQEQIAQLMSQVKTIRASLKTSGRSGSEVRTVKADLRTVRQ
jgi:trimeric autotransporter adhesin